MADPDAVQGLFDGLDEAPDVVVSNAGVMHCGHIANIADSNPLEWLGDVDMGIRAVYLVARAYLRKVRATGRRTLA